MGSILATVTVRRVDPASEGVGQCYINLGRVRVTIDDLAELMTLVKKSNSPEFQVRFNGGYFNKAKDLRDLTDIEMRSLHLNTSTVEITLSSSSALAIGERKEVEDIYQWAQKRQMPPRLRPVQMIKSIPYQSALMLITGLLGLSIVISQVNKPIYTVREFVTIGAASVFSILASVFMWRDLPANQSSYAIIIPMSRDEHRQLTASQKYPRRSWIVAIVAAIIAAAAVGVAIWAVLSR
jgi:hypothetical protein